MDKMDKKMTSRRRSVQTMLHLVLRLAFLAQSRMNSCQDRSDSLRAELVQKVLEGLSRRCLHLAAQDLGVGTLMKDGGIQTSIATLKKMIFPLFSLCSPSRSQGAFPSRTDAAWPLVTPDRGASDFLHLKTTADGGAK